MLIIGRVLNEDEDFITIEFGKRDDVTFHLQQNEEGETVGGDRFLTVLFVHKVDDSLAPQVWVPWKDD